MNDQTFRQLAFVGMVVGAGMLTHRALGKAWEKQTSRPPPKNPAAAEVPWSEALLWGALAGAAVGITRLVARRVLSELMDGSPTPTGVAKD